MRYILYMTWRHRGKGAIWPVRSVICVSGCTDSCNARWWGGLPQPSMLLRIFPLNPVPGFVLSRDLLHASHLSSLHAFFFFNVTLRSNLVFISLLPQKQLFLRERMDSALPIRPGLLVTYYWSSAHSVLATMKSSLLRVATRWGKLGSQGQSLRSHPLLDVSPQFAQAWELPLTHPWPSSLSCHVSLPLQIQSPSPCSGAASSRKLLLNPTGFSTARKQSPHLSPDSQWALVIPLWSYCIRCLVLRLPFVSLC